MNSKIFPGVIPKFIPKRKRREWKEGMGNMLPEKFLKLGPHETDDSCKTALLD
jgi:hypothetical protein